MARDYRAVVSVNFEDLGCPLPYLKLRSPRIFIPLQIRLSSGLIVAVDNGFECQSKPLDVETVGLINFLKREVL
jgi:hypothetical protein